MPEETKSWTRGGWSVERIEKDGFEDYRILLDGENQFKFTFNAAELALLENVIGDAMIDRMRDIARQTVREIQETQFDSEASFDEDFFESKEE